MYPLVCTLRSDRCPIQGCCPGCPLLCPGGVAHCESAPWNLSPSTLNACPHISTVRNSWGSRGGAGEGLTCQPHELGLRVHTSRCGLPHKTAPWIHVGDITILRDTCGGARDRLLSTCQYGRVKVGAAGKGHFCTRTHTKSDPFSVLYGCSFLTRKMCLE